MCAFSSLLFWTTYMQNTALSICRSAHVTGIQLICLHVSSFAQHSCCKWEFEPFKQHTIQMKNSKTITRLSYFSQVFHFASLYTTLATYFHPNNAQPLIVGSYNNSLARTTIYFPVTLLSSSQTIADSLSCW